jgi:hypothetical protein
MRDATAAIRRFELSIDSDLTFQPPGQSKPATAKTLTRMAYTLTPRPQAVDVAVDSMEVRMWKDGMTSLNFRVGRDWARIRQNGRDEEISYPAAQPGLRRMMDEFGRTIASIILDAEGGELGRTLSLSAGSALADNGVVENARMFHVRFPRDKDRWEAPSTFTMGNGQYARGTLRYEKLPPTPGAGLNDPVRVKVSGTLKTGDVAMGPNTFKGGAFRVAGEQVYDPAEREWRSGDLRVDASFAIEAPHQPPGSARGVMKVAMRRAPASVTPDVAGN